MGHCAVHVLFKSLAFAVSTECLWVPGVHVKGGTRELQSWKLLVGVVVLLAMNGKDLLKTLVTELLPKMYVYLQLLCLIFSGMVFISFSFFYVQCVLSCVIG